MAKKKRRNWKRLVEKWRQTRVSASKPLLKNWADRFSFQVTVLREAEKAIRRLPEHYERRVLEVLLIFRENPFQPSIMTLESSKGTRASTELESEYPHNL